MKKLLLLFVLLCISNFSFARNSPLSASLALKNQYMGSNGQLICNQPVIQASATYRVTDDFAFDLWGSSNLDFDSNKCGQEIDYSIIYKFLTVSKFDIGEIGSNDIDIISTKLFHRFGNSSIEFQHVNPRNNRDGFKVDIGHQFTKSISGNIKVGETPFSQESYVVFATKYSCKWKGLSFDFIASHAPFDGAMNQKENLIVSAAYFW